MGLMGLKFIWDFKQVKFVDWYYDKNWLLSDNNL